VWLYCLYHSDIDLKLFCVTSCLCTVSPCPPQLMSCPIRQFDLESLFSM
jgi:hypothetical protein